MNGWVMDCSMTLGFSLPDELSNSADRFLHSITDTYDIWVPPLWWYEVANVLAAAKRKKRISPAQSAQLMSLYRQLPIRTDIGVGGSTFSEYHGISGEYELSAYDAAYLELASRRGLGLATLDKKLLKASRRAGVPVWK